MKQWNESGGDAEADVKGQHVVKLSLLSSSYSNKGNASTLAIKV